MKSSHKFVNLSYVELELLLQGVPALRDLRLRKWGGGGFRWTDIPKPERNNLGRLLRKTRVS